MEDINLKCNATNGLKAFDRVDWFFEGEPLRKSKPRWYGRVQELNRKPYPGRSVISELIIEKATMADRGNYVCRATGKLTAGVKVHVLNGRLFTSTEFSYAHIAGSTILINKE